MRSFLLSICGCLLGAASWLIAGAFSGKFEPFDTTTGFYVCQAVLALPALWAGLRYGFVQALFVLFGAWIGMNVYAYVFGSDETRAWFLLGLFSSLTLLMLPLAAMLFGVGMRAFLGRVATRQSNAASNPAHDANSHR